MKHKGHFGVSMGTIIKKKIEIKPQDRHCSNCIFFYKGICKKVAGISNGRQLYISDKTAAKKCVHYTNRHTDNKSKSRNEKKRDNRSKAEKAKKITKTNKATETVEELTIHEIVDIEILNSNKMRERVQRYVSPFLFECKYNIRKILNVRGDDQIEYKVISGVDTGKTKICSVNEFKNEVIIFKNIENDAMQ